MGDMKNIYGNKKGRKKKVKDMENIETIPVEDVGSGMEEITFRERDDVEKIKY